MNTNKYLNYKQLYTKKKGIQNISVLSASIMRIKSDTTVSVD